MRARFFFMSAVVVAVLVTACRAPVACEKTDLTCDPLALWLYYTSVQPTCLVRSQTQQGWLFFSGGAGEDDFGNNVCGLADGSVIFAAQSNEADPTAQGIAPLTAFGGAMFDINIRFYQAGPDGYLSRWTYFGGPGANHDVVRVTEAPGGGFYAVSSGNVPVTTYAGLTPLIAHQGGGNDIVLLRFDSNMRVLWYTYIGGAGIDRGIALVPTSDGGVMVLGSSDQAHTIQGAAPLQAFAGAQDAVLYRVSAAGSVEWFTFFGGSGFETATGMARVPVEPLFSGQSRASEVFVISFAAAADIATFAGLTPFRAYTGGTDLALAWITGEGVIQRYGFYGSSANEVGGPLVVSRTGAIYVGGGANANIPTLDGLTPLNPYVASSDGWLLRLTGDGTVVNHRFFGSAVVDQIGGMNESVSGDLVLVMHLSNTTSLGVTPVYANAGAVDAAFLRIDAADTIQTFGYYGSALNETGVGIAPTIDGGAILTGEAPGGGFVPPDGVPVLEAANPASVEEYYLRVFADGRTIR